MAVETPGPAPRARRRTARERAHERDGQVRAMRRSLANLRAAAEALAVSRGELEAAPAALLAVVVEEAETLSTQLLELEEALDATAPVARRRRCEVAVLVGSLVTAAARNADLDLAVLEPQMAGTLVDPGDRLVPALVAVLRRLRRDFAVARGQIATRRHEGLLVLDVTWQAGEPEQWRLRQEHAEVLAGANSGGPSLRDVVRDAGGEVWLSFERENAAASLRLLLPLVPS